MSEGIPQSKVTSEITRLNPHGEFGIEDQDGPSPYAQKILAGAKSAGFMFLGGAVYGLGSFASVLFSSERGQNGTHVIHDATHLEIGFQVTTFALAMTGAALLLSDNFYRICHRLKG